MTVGTQDVSACDPGAFTGEVAAAHLADYGIEYAMIGHHERRISFGDNNEIVAEKVRMAQDCGIGIIFCVGENQQEHNEDLMLDVLKEQLQPLNEHVKDWSKIVIVYEPLWALGTGTIASAD